LPNNVQADFPQRFHAVHVVRQEVQVNLLEPRKGLLDFGPVLVFLEPTLA
jgi:hypothetical protein